MLARLVQLLKKKRGDTEADVSRGAPVGTIESGAWMDADLCRGALVVVTLHAGGGDKKVVASLDQADSFADLLKSIVALGREVVQRGKDARK